jgi:hypothetical protein
MLLLIDRRTVCDVNEESTQAEDAAGVARKVVRTVEWRFARCGEQKQ